MAKANKLFKVNGVSVKDALGFFTDGCHKIYVAETLEDAEKMRDLDYDYLHPMSELEKTFDDSCPLRFISWVDLTKPEIVPQCAKRVVFEYNTEKHVLKFV